MPGLIKIGYTATSIEERLAQLNSTGVPVPFDVHALFQVTNPSEVEKNIHKVLEKYRYNKSREFFNITVKQAVAGVIDIILETIASSTVSTQEGANARVCALEEENIHILKSLADRNRRRGYEACQLLDVNDESELETENRLAHLKELGLVEERKSRQEWRGSTWRITSKGVKYIFDNGLVEEYMIKDHY